MKGNIEERAVKLAQYIIENGATVRSAADQFGVSKSTVHMDGTAKRLFDLSCPLWYAGENPDREAAVPPDGRRGRTATVYVNGRQTALRSRLVRCQPQA